MKRFGSEGLGCSRVGAPACAFGLFIHTKTTAAPQYEARRALRYEGKSTMTGTVKWFDRTKGYGFIAPDDGGKDAFVHISAVEAIGATELSEGQKVQYDLESGRNGKQSAANLVLL
jgi:CspA family cold shock protein